MAGYRSPLAFWVGGAAAPPPPPVAAAKRSLVAPWLGGAAAPPAASPFGGRRSLLAPWLGGAAALPGSIQPEPPPRVIGGGRPLRRIPIPPQLTDQYRRRLIDEDELLVLMAAQIAASGLLH